jgi:diaminohydroxyphosphoribosylaminopyrimidine deaminase/5-amino-6-(5-phosphoribosylamino)uracil reductase
VHRQRSVEQALLVGTNTAIKDNPSLTLRDWAGNSPTRIVIDRQLKLPDTLNLFTGEEKTIVLNELENSSKKNVTRIKVGLHNNPAKNILTALYKVDLQSVIIEGGSTTLNLFLKAGLWDEAHVYVGDKLFKTGVRAPKALGDLYYKKEFDDSKLFVYRNIL